MATALKAPEVVGVAEVARLAQVSKKTVSSWVARGSAGLPPHTMLASGPVWNRRHIAAWFAQREIDRLAQTPSA